jgi:hypothetical protein
MCDIKKGSIYFESNENFTINGLHGIAWPVSLHFKGFISWGVLDNAPLYCITLWPPSWYASGQQQSRSNKMVAAVSVARRAGRSVRSATNSRM